MEREVDETYKADVGRENLAGESARAQAEAEEANAQDTDLHIGCRLWSFSGDCPQYGGAECPRSCTRFGSELTGTDRQAKKREQDANLLTEREVSDISGYGSYSFLLPYLQVQDSKTIGRMLAAGYHKHTPEYALDVAAMIVRIVLAAGWHHCPKVEWPVLTNEERVRVLRVFVGTPSEVEEEAVRIWVTQLLKAQRDADRKHCPAQEGQ